MHSRQLDCMLRSGTITSPMRPGSQYAASSKTMISPETPLSDCFYAGGGDAGAGGLVFGTAHGTPVEEENLTLEDRRRIVL